MAAWCQHLRNGRTRSTPSRLGLAGNAFDHSPACPLGPALPIAGASSLPRHAFTGHLGSRNVDLDAIGYAFLPGLRTRLTLGGRTWPRKPWTFGGGDSHPPFRYSCLHDHSHTLQHQFPGTFNAECDALLPSALLRLRGFGCILKSRSFSARHHSLSELLRTLQMVAASEPTS